MESIFVFQNPGATVQGFLLTPQPVIRLMDRYGNGVTVDAGTTVITTTIVAGEGCPTGPCTAACDGTELRGSCFKYVQEPVTLEEARKGCDAWGGKLTSIRTFEENQVVRVVTGTREAWVGLQYSESSSAWIWDDGSQPIGDEAGSYSFVDWAPLEALAPSDRACATINGGPEGNELPWGSGDCERPLPYVCRKATSTVRTTCECCQDLLGSSSVPAIAGMARFTDLRTYSNAGTGLRLHFVAHIWNETIPLRTRTAILTSPFDILPAPSR
ncbi:C-type lectin protein, partial [Baffinella frigidus]